MYGVKLDNHSRNSKGAALTTKNMDNTFNNDISFDRLEKTLSKARPKRKIFYGLSPKRRFSRHPKHLVVLSFGFLRKQKYRTPKTIFEREFYPDELSSTNIF